MSRAVIAAVLGALRQGRSLKAQAARGSIWLMVGSGGLSVLGLVRNVILTRALAPETFGVMAIVLAVLGIFRAFTEVGVSNAIIQSPRGREQVYLNSAWWFSFVRGLILYGLAAAAAPWIARLYGNTELTGFLRVAFISVVLHGAVSARAYVAAKDMRFLHWATIFHGGDACGITAAVILGFALGNVWALVFGLVIGSGSVCILSYVLCPFLPGVRFDRECAVSLFRYARGMLGQPVLNSAYSRCDVFVVGKLYAATEVGLYSMVATLARMPLEAASLVTSQICQPTFSKIQSDVERVNNVFLKMSEGILALGAPFFFLATFYGEDLLLLVYGERYAALSTVFAVIFGSALLKSCNIPVAGIYFGLGRPEMQRAFVGVRAIVILVCIYPLVRYFGTLGAAVAVCGSILAASALQLLRLKRFTKLSARRYLRVLVRGTRGSLCVVVLWALTRTFTEGRTVLNLTIGLIGCVLAAAVGVVPIAIQYSRAMSGEGDSLTSSTERRSRERGGPV